MNQKFQGPFFMGGMLFDVIPGKCTWNITKTFYWPGKFERKFRKGPGSRKTKERRELSYKLQGGF